MHDSLSSPALAVVAIVSLRKCLRHVVALPLSTRAAVRPEPERRVTVEAILGRLRPGVRVVEHEESGYRRVVGCLDGAAR